MLGARLPMVFLTGGLRVSNILTVLKFFDELLVKPDKQYNLYPLPLLVDDEARPERSRPLRGRGRYGPLLLEVVYYRQRGEHSTAA